MAKFHFFELDEFLSSATASRLGIDNTPTFDVVDHLSELTEVLLDPLRAAYLAPITVTSGYRCRALNAAVGGVQNSAHLIGYAADIVPTRGDVDSFARFVAAWLRDTGRRFDQCLIERGVGSHWVHLSLYDGHGRQRGQIKEITI